MAKPSLKKKKKEWFVVEAPAIFKNKELGEIPCFEVNKLKGRTLKLNYSALTGNMKDSDKKFILCICDIKSDTAKTEPKKIYYLNGYTQRATRRYATNIPLVRESESKDKKKIISKLHILARKKLARPVRTQLIKRMEAVLDKKINKVEAHRLFEPNYLEILSKELKKDLKSIYPVHRIAFWHLEIK